MSSKPNEKLNLSSVNTIDDTDSDSDGNMDEAESDATAVHQIRGLSVKDFTTVRIFGNFSIYCLIVSISLPVFWIEYRLLQNASKNITEATKCANTFPAGNSRNLYSAYPAFNNVIGKHSEKILGIISNVLKLQQIRGNIQRRDNDEKLELMLECNDLMLERINSNLDVLAGIRVNHETILVETEIKATPTVQKPLSGSWNETRKILTATRGRTAKYVTNISLSPPNDSLVHFHGIL